MSFEFHTTMHWRVSPSVMSVKLPFCCSCCSLSRFHWNTFESISYFWLIASGCSICAMHCASSRDSSDPSFFA